MIFLYVVIEIRRSIQIWNLWRWEGHGEPACSVPRPLVELADIGDSLPPDGGVFIAILLQRARASA